MNKCTFHDPMAVQRYYDGELPENECIAFEEHLGTCAACQESIQAWRGLSTTLSTIGLESPQHDLAARFAQRVREQQLQSSRHVAWGLLAAASLLLMSSLFLVGYTQSGDGDADAVVAQWEEYVVAQPAVDEEFTDLESRTLVAIHIQDTTDYENRND